MILKNIKQLEAKNTKNKDDNVSDKLCKDLTIHNRGYDQLVEIKESHGKKWEKMNEDLELMKKFPGAEKNKYYQNDKTLTDEQLEEMYQEEFKQKENKVYRLADIVFGCDEEIRLRSEEKVTRKIID